MEQAARTGLERQQWTTGADHGRMTLADWEVLDQGHQQKAPAASDNRGFLSAFGNSSYQKPTASERACGDDTLSQKPPPAMMLIHL